MIQEKVRSIFNLLTFCSTLFIPFEFSLWKKNFWHGPGISSGPTWKNTFFDWLQKLLASRWNPWTMSDTINIFNFFLAPLWHHCSQNIWRKSDDVFWTSTHRPIRIWHARKININTIISISVLSRICKRLSDFECFYSHIRQNGQTHIKKSKRKRSCAGVDTIITANFIVFHLIISLGINISLLKSDAFESLWRTHAWQS